MRVHVEEFVNGRGKLPSTRTDEETRPKKVLEHLSRIYGYAWIGLLWTVLFILVLCAPEYTVYMSGKDKNKPPAVNRTTWGVALSVLFPLLFALRTMFGGSLEDPRPLPGRNRYTWRYAP